MRYMMYGLLVLSLLVVGPPLVVAAPIQITDGTLTFSSPLFVLGAFSLSNADRSFQASGAVNAVLTPFGPAQMCVPCPGLTTISTDILPWTEDDLSGAVSVNGVSYGLGDFLFGPVLELNFAGGSFTLPPVSPTPATAVLPFTLDGSFIVRDHGIPQASYPFAGTGTATFTYVPFQFVGDSRMFWRFDSAHYTVADPMPEPTSCLLLLTGLAGVAQRRYHSRQSRRSRRN